MSIMSIMPRIQISHVAARALKVAAAMRDKRPHAYMEELIFAACEPKEPDRPSNQVATEPSNQVTIKPSSQVATEATKPHKKKRNQPDNYRPRINSQPDLVKKIDEMQAAGAGLSEIAKTIGYPVQTLSGFLQRRAKQL